MKTIKEKIKEKEQVQWLHQIQVAREIVKKINDFGVSQKQILHIIKLLALELENKEIMDTIISSINDATGEETINPILIPEN